MQLVEKLKPCYQTS